MSGVLHLCVYNNNLHSLVRNTVHRTALVLILYPQFIVFVKNTYFWSMIPSPRRGIFYP